MAAGPASVAMVLADAAMRAGISLGPEAGLQSWDKPYRKFIARQYERATMHKGMQLDAGIQPSRVREVSSVCEVSSDCENVFSWRRIVCRIVASVFA